MKKLFHGKNSHLAHQESKREYDSLCVKFPEYEKITIDATAIEIDKVAESYKSIGMFSSGKILLIKRLCQNKRYPEIVEDLKSADLENVYILFVEDEKIASNTKYFKLFDLKTEVYEAAVMNKRSFISWSKDILKLNSLEASEEAIYQLAENCNYDTERLEHEISKYTVSGLKRITVEAIKEISPDTHENDIWELIEALNSSNKQIEAITILENLFQSNTDAYYIIAMLVRNLRQMILVKDMSESGFENKEICSKLRIPPFTLPQIKSASSKYTIKALTDLYEKITNMDFETKIGNIEPKVGLTLMLVLFEKYLTR